MAYASWSVTSLEQPTLAKWNILGTNDAFFNTQVGSNFSSGTTSTVWWEELGRQTLSGNATSMSVTPIAARKFLMVLIDVIPSGSVTQQLRFNNDSAANYSYRYSFNEGAATAGVSQTQGIFSPNGSNNYLNSIIYITNIAAQEKLAVCSGGDQATAGAGTAPSTWNLVSKWANTAAQISRIDCLTSTNNFASGSSLIVLGHD